MPSTTSDLASVIAVQPTPATMSGVTAVPPSPDERMPMTPIPKPTSTKAHFNASLDVALQLLQKRNGQIENTDPQTP
ncbi:hypothetical protein J3F82_005664, partial [Coemansia sp. RSA 637]